MLQVFNLSYLLLLLLLLLLFYLGNLKKNWYVLCEVRFYVAYFFEFGKYIHNPNHKKQNFK